VFGPPASRGAYSLIAAARGSDRGVGFALKLAQRAWALRQGVRTISWTFDPLLPRNARFNLVKLGAVAGEYVVDFYGPLADGVNDGDETDRLTARWELAGERAGRAARGRPAAIGEPPPTTDRGAPDGGPLVVRDGDGLWCRVPSDILALRRDDPAEAARWRSAVRAVLRGAFADGLVATGMTRGGWYRLTPAS
jgi:predicted GNAT superfamily acetyltransferase